MATPEPTVRIEATRFTVTPEINVPDLHNVRVQVEQQRDGLWIPMYHGAWLNRAGEEVYACTDSYEQCAADFGTAITTATEAARRIAGRYGRGE